MYNQNTKEMDITLTKSQTFNLAPYGKFFISMARNPKNAPHIINFRELSTYHDTAMPFTDEQETEIVKFMKKHKTDILIDSKTYRLYTRTGSGLTRVEHEKLTKYREDEGFRSLVDNR